MCYSAGYSASYLAAKMDPNLTHSGPATPLESRASGPLSGQVRVPGDKSISHRALILGALAVGETRISGLLEGEDVLNTAKSMQALGARVERTGPFAWQVAGVGVAGFAQPASPLDFGNSGTGCRLVMGAVAGCPITAVFDGDASLRSRPMRRILDPLELMGAKAGESKELTVEVNPKYLSIFNVEQNGWQLLSGEYSFMVGGSSQSLPLKQSVTLN